ncbi:ATP-binding protein [Streptomyces sp. NPDC088725]|uniref:ATP-binding protein n=1 Tax=Streptomyces sp. NPDC088725 TaxID=3365873 RepID=UPI00380490EB
MALDSRSGLTSSGRSMAAGVAYDGGPGMIAEARRFVTDFLESLQSTHGVPVSSRMIGTGQLVVSELVTNVCKYAPGPCLLDVEFLGDVVEITVWDADSTLPFARAAEPGRIGQHGLEIVLALCEGFDVRREPVGKRIKVRLAV